MHGAAQCPVSEAFWGKKLEKEPGVRWLNKAADEFYEEDRFAHLVFGLEQLLLRDETERSYLNYKRAIRGAWLLGRDRQGRKNVFQRLREAYKLRTVFHDGSRPHACVRSSIMRARTAGR